MTMLWDALFIIIIGHGLSENNITILKGRVRFCVVLHLLSNFQDMVRFSR